MHRARHWMQGHSYVEPSRSAIWPQKSNQRLYHSETISAGEDELHYDNPEELSVLASNVAVNMSSTEYGRK